MFVISLDSIRIADNVPLVDALTEDDTLWSKVELPSKEEFQQLRERLEPYLDLIPEIEGKILEMRLRGVTEAVIGKHYGATQSAICYRLQRAVVRVQWHINRPPRPDTLYEDILAVVPSVDKDKAARAVTIFADENSYKHANDAISVCYSTLRHWVAAALARLPDGPAKDYLAYSYERVGIKHGNDIKDGIEPGSLARKTKGKL